jgi:hypothetical protein
MFPSWRKSNRNVSLRSNIIIYSSVIQYSFHNLANARQYTDMICLSPTSKKHSAMLIVLLVRVVPV